MPMKSTPSLKISLPSTDIPASVRAVTPQSKTPPDASGTMKTLWEELV